MQLIRENVLITPFITIWSLTFVGQLMKINGLGGLLFNVKFFRIRHIGIIAVVPSEGNAIIYLPNQKSNFFFPVVFPLFDSTHQQFNSRQRSVFFFKYVCL